MTDPQAAMLMLGVFIFVIALGFPIAFSLMALGVAFGYYAYFEPDRMWRTYNRLVDADFWTTASAWVEGFFNNRVFALFVTRTYEVMFNDVLTAIPLFLFMGYIVERANIVDRLFRTVLVAMRNVPGSMAVAAMITCALFATATGIVGAVVTLMGLLAFPAMLKNGYDKSFAAGVICAGGTLGILIPPSVMLIVYGNVASVSVVRLYAAAFLPGFLLAGLYLTYILIRSWVQPKVAPKPSQEDIDRALSSGNVYWQLLTSFLPLALLILSVLGAIIGGFATPSEAAAVGAIGGLVLAAGYRALTWQKLRESVYLTVRTAAMVCWLFVGSGIFASIFGYLGGQQLISEFVTGLDMSPLVFMLLAQFIIFLLGWPLEWSEICIIFVPIFVPLLAHFGVDPLFFGILIALNLQTSFLSPPMAMSAYYLKGIAGDSVQITEIFRGMVPFLLIVILAMVLVYVFPQIAFFLPDSLYGAQGGR